MLILDEEGCSCFEIEADLSPLIGALLGYSVFLGSGLKCVVFLLSDYSCYLRD